MTDIMKYETYRNEQRFKRLRQRYTRTLSPQEHTELIQRGEAIRREWHARPIPSHKALTVVEADGETVS